MCNKTANLWRNLLNSRQVVSGLIAIAVGCLLWLGLFRACNDMVGLKQDHPAEELAEAYLEQRFGMPEGSIDLSPE